MDECDKNFLRQHTKNSSKIYVVSAHIYKKGEKNLLLIKLIVTHEFQL